MNTTSFAYSNHTQRQEEEKDLSRVKILYEDSDLGKAFKQYILNRLF